MKRTVNHDFDMRDRIWAAAFVYSIASQRVDARYTNGVTDKQQLQNRAAFDANGIVRHYDEWMKTRKVEVPSETEKIPCGVFDGNEDG